MTYQETLNYLYSKLPMFSKVGVSAYKKDITNTVLLCESIGNPHKKFKSIHIAGTNGKGSTSHMLAAIMQTAGYKTGLYTSPHLKDFRERIKVDGIMCDENFVIEFVQKIKLQIDLIQPSFFEVTVAMAFEYFALQKVDIAVIETGLGGRLDSTNIIQPIISVITNIGYDHMDILGNTLPEIAFEKAGIIKKNTPVVIGESLPETKQVFINKSHQENAAISFAHENFNLIETSINHQLQNIEYNQNDSLRNKKIAIDLLGIYQTKNLFTILETCSQLNKIGFKLEEEIISTALQQTKKITGLLGRWQIIGENPLIILDVAHNKDGVNQIIQQLPQTSYNNLHCIFGMVKDKDHDAVLQLLPKNAHYYFTQAQIERALSCELLQQKAHQFNLKGQSFSNVNSALATAKKNATTNDVIIVFGSVFLIAEVDY
jgi:dihydrofolate synthase / folylpolyglutamate synthase